MGTANFLITDTSEYFVLNGSDDEYLDKLSIKDSLDFLCEKLKEKNIVLDKDIPKD